MEIAQGSNRRRSQRVLLNMPIVVHGQGDDKKPFREETQTLVVNAHGALVTLATKVRQGSKVALVNKASEEEQECRVVYLGPRINGKPEVGLEFLRPAPHFWHIAFPPEDWKPEPRRQPA